ncbi:UdgX family uracil-DNA binding protein [Ideonella sp. BN130291]|uniref:UdgX family uracil-DNA binding protein n=1 Tax=Ideonella sp. BN130291 TaxID=3112940 RepID=UPI002E270892|nr:UdgX family uracil-DNA binding protein [Ideonella sp. BN130291]MED5620853.1 UdgX family uracil-DNA binding protein [Ideonella sp. BN130291]
MHIVTLADAADVMGWRHAARRLLQQGQPPDAVDWQVLGDDAPGLFKATTLPGDGHDDTTTTPRVPAGFITLASQALLHRDPGRFHLMYRLLWRLVQDPALRHDPLDSDMLAARQLAQQVRRDQYEMRAFLRFHERATPHGPQYVAWFEPQHHVVASQAPFFQARFASMRWAIFTPERSIGWDGTELHIGCGARREDIPLDDARTALWLTYYASIFNPARPKPAHMQQQMPRRLWHNLPEAPLIAPLMAAAAHRTDTMVEHGPSDAQRRRPALPPSASDVDAWAAALDRCRDCPHAAHATQAVPGEGPRDAPVVLVGEQPGDMEDLLGRPFAGPAGQLLDQALAAAGLPRERLYLTNAVKHFRFELRGKRRLHKTPGQREIENCRGWLERELGAMPARHLVALGSTAAQSLLGRKVGIGEHRGQWLPTADGREVLVTWHPAALLRMPAEQREPAFETWVGDLRRVAEAAIR